MNKRYFVYVTCSSGFFVREHSYFDNLEEAIRFGQIHADTWNGYWAVTDTTRQIDKTVAHGNCLKEVA